MRPLVPVSLRRGIKLPVRPPLSSGPRTPSPLTALLLAGWLVLLCLVRGSRRLRRPLACAVVSADRPHVAMAPDAPPAVAVTVITRDSPLEECRQALAGEALLAVDVEGYRLSRFGRPTLVQVGTRSGRCFLFDVLNAPPDGPMVCLLRESLEDAATTKIIHDCRVDSDALFHRLGIRLAAVHDTQLGAGGALGLNDTLRKYNIPTNPSRDKQVYKDNPAFWMRRPLTPLMIDWASRDIGGLFRLYDRQTVAPLGPDRMRDRDLREACDARLVVLRDAVAQPFTMRPLAARQFIGRQGHHLRTVEEVTGVTFAQTGGPEAWAVYARDPAAIAAALGAIGRFIA